MSVLRSKREGSTGSETAMLGTTSSLRAVLEDAPAALLLMDEARNIVYRNKAGVEILRETTALVGEDGVRQLREHLARHGRDGRQPAGGTTYRITSGGRTIVVKVSMSDVPGGHVVTWRNITAEAEQEIAATELAEELSNSGQSLARQGETLAAATRTASEQAELLASGAAELKESIREIASGAAAAAENSESAVSTTRAAADGMEGLQRSTAEIANIADVIRGIAEQTNLLALNATIESARAGSAGSGFAVVAGEVKELARNTAQATETIRTLVETIHADTIRAGASITKAMDLISDVANRQASIAGAVEEQSAVATSMATSVQEVTSATKAAAATLGTTMSTAEGLVQNAARLRNLVTSS